jgi:hypothetical protein
MQQTLFYDDIYEALLTDVMALGGSKTVGLMLWPEKKEKAGDYLKTCLNRDRAEKLSIDQIMLIVRRAKEVGSYATATFFCDETGFAAPQPIEPEDERATLQRAFIQSVEHQRQMLERMERLAVPATISKGRGRG